MINQKTLSSLCIATLAMADWGVQGQQQIDANGSIEGADLNALPVRQSLVDEVKSKTKKWIPREVDDNHFKGKTVQEISGTLGGLDAGKAKLTHTDESDPFAFLGEKYMNQKSRGFFDFSSLYQKTIGSISQTLLQTKKSSEYDDFVYKIEGMDDATRDKQRVRESKRPKIEKITGDPKLPPYFNNREKYPQCKPRVLNQQMCGSCWAFSSAGILEDRFCQHSDGQIKVTLSPQDMVDCDFENFGCRGGYMVPALDFLITEGVTNYDCLPYKNDKRPCSFSCDSKGKTYDKYYCKPGSMRIETDIYGMQQDIYQNGPVMVGLMVYEDLYSYKSGVYEYVAGGLIGGHSIRAVGWGHDEDGHLYWICQNQWTDQWGKEGYVNIKAGEVGIDYWSLSCMPDINVKRK